MSNDIKERLNSVVNKTFKEQLGASYLDWAKRLKMIDDELLKFLLEEKSKSYNQGYNDCYTEIRGGKL